MKDLFWGEVLRISAEFFAIFILVPCEAVLVQPIRGWANASDTKHSVNLRIRLQIPMILPIGNPSGASSDLM
jgi:hypothetical protein